MGRIADQDRLAVLDAIGHWQQADAQQGVPIEIVTGYGVAQLQTDRDAYHDKQEVVAQLESDLEAVRAERDGAFGLGPDDDDGAWFRLKQSKAFVRARLGVRHPLRRTVPNLGRVRVERYLAILHRFIDRWERVNAQLEPDLTLGTYALTDLQTAHDNLVAKAQEVEQFEQVRLPLAGEEREQMFGDEREETSIVARLLLYYASIGAMFPDQPLADSLPEIFPAADPGLPTFRFNWSQEPGISDLTTWFESPGINEATEVFLKEGVVEQTTSFDPGGGNVISEMWCGMIVVDDLDKLELRDSGGITSPEASLTADWRNRRHLNASM